MFTGGSQRATQKPHTTQKKIIKVQNGKKLKKLLKFKYQKMNKV